MRNLQGFTQRRFLFVLILLFVGFCLLVPDAVWAAGPSVSIDLGSEGPKQTAVVIQILISLTVLSLADRKSTRLNSSH